MTVEYCLAICQKYEANYNNYKKDGSFSSNPSAMPELNNVHTFLYGKPENIMCHSCRKNMINSVYRWYYQYKINNQPNTQPSEDLSRLTRSELIKKANDKEIKLPRNVDKATLIKLLSNV